MGRDKAFLSIGSRTLIDIVIAHLRPCVERVVVIGRASNEQPLGGLPVDEVLVDYRLGQGPLMGIYTGLMHTQTPLNIFVPCDMPWIEERLIKRLLAHRVGGILVVASLHPDEGIQPFPLVCHTDACRTVGTLLDKGERTLQTLFQPPHAQLVRIDEPELWRSFTNVNTQEDYARLQEEKTFTPR